MWSAAARWALDRALHKGKVTPEDREAALGRLTFTTDVADLADRQRLNDLLVGPLRRQVIRAGPGSWSMRC